MPISDLTGTTWVLNDSIAYMPSGYHLNGEDNLGYVYAINFSSNGNSYSSITFGDIDYFGNDGGFAYGNTKVYNQATGYTNNAYKMISITGGTDATNASLISWLEANATQLPVADLTNTTWALNNNASATSGYGNFSVNGTCYGSTIDFLAVGYGWDSGEYMLASSANSLTYGLENDGSTVDSLSLPLQYEVVIEITGGTDATNATLIAWLAQNATMQQPTPSLTNNLFFGTNSVSKIYFGSSEVSKIYLGNTLVYEAAPSITVDPVLNNNSWEVIKQVCEAGQAADYWSLGDTKTDTGTDNVTRTFRICDMSGMYGKNVVFEQVELTESGIVWNASSNTDDNSCYNNYNISDMRNTALPALLANYSSDLQTTITNTTYKVAKNGTANPMVLLDLTDKLFLPAEREIFGTQSYSVTDEWNALSRFALYALSANDNATFRKKYKPSTPTSANAWWERSPGAGNTRYVCDVSNYGSAYYYLANGDSRVAPCFAY